MLSSRTAAGAEILSYIAAVGCILMAVPPVLIGAIAKSTGKTRKYSHTKGRVKLYLIMLFQQLEVYPF